MLANERISIVEDTPGVTRDRLYATTEWLEREFIIIDTGGIEIANTDKIAVSIREQAQIAIREADVILFVCDARTGITDEDAEVAKLLRKSKKPIVLAVNKADSSKHELGVYEFYNLGLGDPIPISAANHIGLGDMLDALTDKVNQTVPAVMEDDDEDEIKVALMPAERGEIIHLQRPGRGGTVHRQRCGRYDARRHRHPGGAGRTTVPLH